MSTSASRSDRTSAARSPPSSIASVIARSRQVRRSATNAATSSGSSASGSCRGWRTSRPPLRGPTAGQPLAEAGLRRIFRTHRLASGAVRVRPHRLRHTYGTELASAGIDLLALRDLMGHANPETTAAYVHLSPETLAAEYARARAAAR